MFRVRWPKIVPVLGVLGNMENVAGIEVNFATWAPNPSTKIIHFHPASSRNPLKEKCFPGSETPIFSRHP